MTDFHAHLFFTCLLIFLSHVCGEVQLECNTATTTSLNGLCPVGYTMVMSDECCPVADVYNTSTTSSACQDNINPNTGVSDCPGMASYCQNPDYHDIMKDQCPKTCGYCTSPTSNTCQDKINPNTGVSDCPGMKCYCSIPIYVNVMKDQCPETCGYCTSQTSNTCQDKINPNTGVSDCPGMKCYCSIPIYVNVMKDQCPKTCGYCTSPTSGQFVNMSLFILVIISVYLSTSTQ